ncbi:ulp1 protease family, C-terminal catalytic domain-containing protein [Tanacetum coccineum]
MNAIPMENFDDDCQIILLKYWLEDPRPFARTRKRNHTGYVKDHNTIVHCLKIPEILVVPWVEDLSRPPNSHNRKVTFPAYFDNIYHLSTKTTHIFSWNKTGHSVDHDFWLTLLGCSNRGWLSDKHLDIWFDLMWKFRQPDDDWAIASPYFYALVMRGEVPFWPANGVKYPVPWTEVDRVKFEVAANVPIQGNAYRDCRVWVCIFLHRLCQNLPVSTDHDPTHVGLAYREHMVDYLWKYRIPEPRFKSIAKCG